MSDPVCARCLLSLFSTIVVSVLACFTRVHVLHALHALAPCVPHLFEKNVFFRFFVRPRFPFFWGSAPAPPACIGCSLSVSLSNIRLSIGGVIFYSPRELGGSRVCARTRSPRIVVGIASKRAAGYSSISLFSKQTHSRTVGGGGTQDLAAPAT